jgi:hypothetical protein
VPYLVFGYKQGNLFSGPPPGAEIAVLDAASKDADVTLTTPTLASSPKFVQGRVRSTIGKNIGKWYWEVQMTTETWSWTGVSSSSFGNEAILQMELPIGTVVGIALDVDGGIVEFYVNGILQGNRTQVISPGTWYAYNRTRLQATTRWAYTDVQFNFGQSPFIHAPPAGFAAGLYNVS